MFVTLYVHHAWLSCIANLRQCLLKSLVSSPQSFVPFLLCSVHLCIFIYNIYVHLCPQNVFGHRWSILFCFLHFYVALTVGFYFSEEFLSVYVGNLSPSTSVFDLEKVFQDFGRIKPDGVAIRSRKVSCLLLNALMFTFLHYCLCNSSTDMQEAGVFFGFVEFEDMSGIQNALSVSFP